MNVLIVLVVVIVAAGALLRSRRSSKARVERVPVDLAELTTPEGVLVDPPEQGGAEADAEVDIAEPEPEEPAGGNGPRSGGRSTGMRGTFPACPNSPSAHDR